jgi:acyl-coenzyme A thioesterase PaaI-like protein
MVPTLQMSVSYLEPTPVARVIARGQVLRMGQTTAHLEGHLRLPDGTLLRNGTRKYAFGSVLLHHGFIRCHDGRRRAG